MWRQLQKATAERVLKAELTHHLGHPTGGERGADGKARNGSSRKTLLTESGPVNLSIPRDRVSFTVKQTVVRRRYGNMTLVPFGDRAKLEEPRGNAP